MPSTASALVVNCFIYLLFMVLFYFFLSFLLSLQIKDMFSGTCLHSPTELKQRELR